MEIRKAISSVIQELIVPELDQIRCENPEPKAELASINRRIDDVHARLDYVNAHLVEQGRLIDAIREELTHLLIYFSSLGSGSCGTSYPSASSMPVRALDTESCTTRCASPSMGVGVRFIIMSLAPERRA